jgi:adenylate kinase family enzyme
MVVGGPGSGKSTVAAALARRLDAPHVELDELWWDPNWAPAGRDVVRDRLTALLGSDRWVVDGNYVDEIADLVWPRADTILWLDVPRHVGVRRAVLRSARRALRRSELWNGSRESLAVLSPPAILGLVKRWPTYPEAIERTITELEIGENVVTRVHSLGEADRWMEST